jgi:2-phospho-L-lactate guanylyltransferase (CobY/MobA/RfbA family)
LTEIQEPTGPTLREPTLLVFTLGAAGEARRHPLLPGALRQAELGLRQECLDAVLRAGPEAACRVAVSSPVAPAAPLAWIPQAGDAFGERFQGALEAAFEGSAGPVVLVGSDIPGIDGSVVRQALAALEGDADRVVIGPSPDGGFYLLAASRPLGDALASVRWCGRETLRTLRAALALAGRPVTLLQPLADLDRPADLDCWLRRRPSPALQFACLQPLRRLLADWRRPSLFSPHSVPDSFRAAPTQGRAPPIPAC